MNELMPVPDEVKWNEIATEFWERWQFPNCIGALDGKHVTIQAPKLSGSLYYNYKKTYSIVLLALVDPCYNFIFVDVATEEIQMVAFWLIPILEKNYSKISSISQRKNVFQGQTLNFPWL